jgi:hypothetical protein
MKSTKNRLTTKAKPFGIEFLTPEQATVVNGGQQVFGLTMPHHGHHHKPIFGLITSPSAGS